MTPLGLAWRSLVRQPARAALGIIGVTAVGALLFDMLLLSGGLVVSFGDLLEEIGFQVRVTATEALPGTGPPLREVGALASRLEQDPAIDSVVAFRFSQATIDSAGEASEDAVELTLMVVRPGRRSPWSVLEGQGLVDGDHADVLINRRLASGLALKPGDTLTLRLDCGFDSTLLPPARMNVRGVVEFPFDVSRQQTATVGLGWYDARCGGETANSADLFLVAEADGVSPEAAVQAIEKLEPELFAFTNAQLVRRFRLVDFSYFRQISFVLTLVTFFFAFLLITALLTVSVNQRLAEVAALRALGLTRLRIVADLICESVLLVGLGGLAALPVGLLLGRGLDTILKQMPGLPERLHFFVFQPKAVLIHLALLALAGLLAAAYPVWLAARLPIAATLRRETLS